MVYRFLGDCVFYVCRFGIVLGWYVFGLFLVLVCVCGGERFFDIGVVFGGFEGEFGDDIGI